MCPVSEPRYSSALEDEFAFPWHFMLSKENLRVGRNRKSAVCKIHTNPFPALSAYPGINVHAANEMRQEGCQCKTSFLPGMSYSQRDARGSAISPTVGLLLRALELILHLLQTCRHQRVVLTQTASVDVPQQTISVIFSPVFPEQILG